MGQKSNILTLKSSFINLNLQTQYSKFFLYGNAITLILNKLLLRKNIVLSRSILNFAGNTLFLNLQIFLKTAKVFYYKKKKFKKKNLSLLLLKKELHFLFLKNFFKSLIFLKTNTLVFSISIQNKELNTKLNKKLLYFFYKKNKPFLNILFQRRFTLFFDFIKQIVLLLNGLIDSKFFLQTLSQLFKFLHKKTHTKFFVFFNLISNLIVNISHYKIRFLKSEIKGLKLLIKGRIRGKMRASLKYLQEGQIPAQSFNKTVTVSKQHVCTLYGVYGLTL